MREEIRWGKCRWRKISNNFETQNNLFFSLKEMQLKLIEGITWMCYGSMNNLTLMFHFFHCAQHTQTKVGGIKIDIKLVRENFNIKNDFGPKKKKNKTKRRKINFPSFDYHAIACQKEESCKSLLDSTSFAPFTSSSPFVLYLTTQQLEASKLKII